MLTDEELTAALSVLIEAHPVLDSLRIRLARIAGRAGLQPMPWARRGARCAHSMLTRERRVGEPQVSDSTP